MFLLKWFTSSSPPHSITVVPENPKISTEQGVTIMDMPDLVMRKILEDVDFVSMLNLRKVCEAFQYYIDENYMDFTADDIRIDIKNRSVNLRLLGLQANTFRKEKTTFNISFKNFFNGNCWVHSEDGDRWLPSFCVNADFLEEFEICLEGIMRNLKAPLKSFEFWSSSNTYIKHQRSIPWFFGCCKSQEMKTSDPDYIFSQKHQKTIENIEKILKSRRHPIGVKKLVISIFDPENLSKIVPNIDKETLTHLEIRRQPGGGGSDPIVDLDEILDFRSFSNLKHLRVVIIIFNSSTESISHIPKRIVLWNSDME